MKRIVLLAGSVIFAITAVSQSKTPELNTKMVGAVLVPVTAAKADMLINPNPVTEHSFNLELRNLQKGKYQVYLYDTSGKKYTLKKLDFDGGSATEVLTLPEDAATGVYILQVVSKEARLVKKLIVE